jgi:anaerobic sulfite reductase subunit A
MPRFTICAPVLMKEEGCFSDTDIVRYGKVNSLDDIEWNKKSDYSFKEVLLKIRETLFYFTEGHTIVPEGPRKPVMIFLRACDLHALKRIDEIYLRNGFEDYYYARVRNEAKFVLMGCAETCE